MIRFDHVTKTYAGTSRPALNAVDLEILKGEFVFLVGASGSGKSSFLRLVLKEERPTKGKIHVLGHDLTTLPNRKVPYFRRSLGVVFQDFRLLPQKTVFDNVAFSLQVIGKSRGFIQEAVPDVLKMVGLAGKQGRFPHELSGGEQQRVAIARAIVNKPAILLADEPTGNLDPATSAGIMSLLATINANGTTVLMATHDSGIVDQMKRRVIELISGQVVRDERAGAYQTQAIPLQKVDMSGPLGTGTISTPDRPAPNERLAPAPAPAAPRVMPSPAPGPQPAPTAPRVVAAPDPARARPVESRPVEPRYGEPRVEPLTPPPLNEPLTEPRRRA
jgi:cell division transport system ATP-binding protein